MLRRVLRVLAGGCLVLAACGTSDAATPEAPSTVGDVGVLPGTLPGGPTVPSTDVRATTSAPSATTDESTPSTPRVADGGTTIGRLADGNRVLVIGDSIMASISERYGGQLCEELVPRGWVVEVAAEVGRFVRFGREVLEERPPEDWDAAVVMLGNNYDGDPEGFARELGLLLDELQSLPVVLLTVTRFEPEQDQVNWIVAGEADRRDGVVLLDWTTPTAEETPGSDELLSGDGLHLTTEGQQTLAEGIGRVLGDAPGAADGDCLRSTFRNDSNGSIPDDPRGGDDGPDGDRRSSVPRVATTTVARPIEPEATTAARSRADPDRPDEPDVGDPSPGVAPDPTPAR